jgi:hypothetical protein
MLDWRTLTAPFTPIGSGLACAIFLFLIPVLWTGSSGFQKVFVFMVLQTVILNVLFTLEGKNRLETLCATLAVTRKDVVQGKYLFVVCHQMSFLLLFFLLARIFRGSAAMILSADMTPSRVCLLSSGLFLGSAACMAVQCSFHFKWGTQQMQGLGYLLGLLFGGVASVLGIAISLFVVAGLDSPSIAVSTHPGGILTVSIVLGLGLLYLSYRLSLKFYLQRDL